METITHTRDEWDEIIENLRAGDGLTRFSTGSQCRLAPALADWIEAELAASDDDPVGIAFEDDGDLIWDIRLTLAQAA